MASSRQNSPNPRRTPRLFDIPIKFAQIPEGDTLADEIKIARNKVHGIRYLISYLSHGVEVAAYNPKSLPDNLVAFYTNNLNNMSGEEFDEPFAACLQRFKEDSTPLDNYEGDEDLVSLIKNGWSNINSPLEEIERGIPTQNPEELSKIALRLLHAEAVKDERAVRNIRKVVSTQGLTGEQVKKRRQTFFEAGGAIGFLEALARGGILPDNLSAKRSLDCNMKSFKAGIEELGIQIP